MVYKSEFYHVYCFQEFEPDMNKRVFTVHVHGCT